jgi:uncharacterized protein (TIGR00297 family)
MVAAVVTISFSALARALRGVSRSGMIAGAAVCFVLVACAGLAAFAALVTVFVLAWASTKLGYHRKQQLGTAERKDGRKASQVLANLSASAACALLYATTGQAMFVVAMAGALAEAAADTVSSEVGQATGRMPRLITTGQTVPIGTDGAVSGTGTAAGFAAALMVGVVCMAVRLIGAPQAAIVFGAAVLGMFSDSLLGAWLEHGGLIGNDTVNFVSTVVAAATGASVYWFLS